MREITLSAPLVHEERKRALGPGLQGRSLRFAILRVGAELRRNRNSQGTSPDWRYGQSVAFRNNLATMQEIFRLEDLGLLAPPADWYLRQTKPMEKLYDTDAGRPARGPARN